MGLREAIVRAIPASLKYAVSADIGIFIALIGARGAGIIAANEAKNSLVFGSLGSPEVITAVFGFVIPGMTTYLESSAGIEAGGKTGLTVVFTGICFLLALFFAPVALVIPSAATAPVLVYIGISMLEAMRHIKYDDMTESMPAFMCVVFTVLAGNIANGICTAILTYLVMKTAEGKTKEIHPFMYLLGAVSMLYFYTLF